MYVGSLIELYTTVFGWYMYGQIWDVLVETGIVFLPFIGLILSIIIEPLKSMEGTDASTASIRRMEIGLITILAVILLAGAPVITLSTDELSFQQPRHKYACDERDEPLKVISANKNETTYDGTFNTVTLGGGSADIPVLWYATIAVSSGINEAIMAGIPCEADIRAMSYELDRTSIEDPALRRETQEFYNNCFIPARSDFLAERPDLPTGIDESDTEWIGSRILLTNYYAEYRARRPVPGFAYSPSRDTEYEGVTAPEAGKPQCDEWWNSLRPRLLTQVEPGTLNAIRGYLPGFLGLTEDEVDDRALRTIISKDEIELRNDPAAVYGGYGLNQGNAVWAHIRQGTMDAAGTVGGVFESFSFFPKMYMIREAAPMIQSVLLMTIYMLIPFVLVFSRFKIETVVFLMIAIFSIKFWTVLWGVAYWLDNNLMGAISPQTGLFPHVGRSYYANGLIIHFIVGALYIFLPLIWTSIVSWAGFSVGHAFGNAVNSKSTDSASAGSKGGKAAGSTAKTVVTKGASKGK